MASIIPVIDIGQNNKDASTQLLSAASKYGFVYVQNNDAASISPADISHMFDLSRAFFAAPTEVKEAVSISSNKAGKNHGYLGRGVEKLDPKVQKRADVKEALNFGEPVDGNLQQPLPITLQPHKQTLMDFQTSCHRLCEVLLRQFAVALGIPDDWFTSRHDQSKGPSGTVFRLLFYPQVGEVEEGIDIRAGAHSDYGSLTLLFQLPGQPGLEIRTPGGDWVPVPVDPTAEDGGLAVNGSTRQGKTLPILVNIGDLLEDWTGGLLKSTVHRVVFPTGDEPGADRYSIAYFCHPQDDAELVPVPSRLVVQHTNQQGSPKKRREEKAITAKDHLMKRLAASYTVG